MRGAASIDAKPQLFLQFLLIQTELTNLLYDHALLLYTIHASCSVILSDLELYLRWAAFYCLSIAHSQH